MSSKKENISCPHCNKPGTWTPENKFKPFCSDRCKLIDLGEWASETRRIPGDPASTSDIPSHPDDEKDH